MREGEKEKTGFFDEEAKVLARYGDILNLPRPVSADHPPMTRAERAAQFSPFAALTGYGDAIRETGRFTQSRTELEGDEMALLQAKLARLEAQAASHPRVSLTCFVPDARKEGGAYVTREGRLKRLDPYRALLILEDGTEIPLDTVIHLESEA